MPLLRIRAILTLRAKCRATGPYTLFLGLNRARYLMFVGQILSAQEAKDLGLISEIHPRDQLLGRAWEIAEKLSKKDDLLLRYTRIVLTEPLGKWMEEMVVYHLGMEALAKLDNEDVHSDEEELGLDPGGAGVGKS